MPDQAPIYLDHAATTPVAPEVIEAMLPYLTGQFGNAASRSHSYGWEAEKAVKKARGQVAKLIGAKGTEIVFTSGATEANNLAIKGIMRAQPDRQGHIITTAIEHKAVLDTVQALEREGYSVSIVGVDGDGRVDPKAIEDAITDETAICSVMLANNETGTLQSVKEIAAVCRMRGVLMHCDAVQAAGKVPVDVDGLGADILSLSAHKMYGPKGIGAMYLRTRTPKLRLEPIIHGGGHERGLRSGTLPVHQIVGFGEAAAVASRELAESAEAPRQAALRDLLWKTVSEQLDGVRVNGSMEHRLPNIINVGIEGVDAEAMLLGMRDLAMSTGSACTSSSYEPSHVLSAMGIPTGFIDGSLRISLGRSTGREDVEFVGSRIVETVQALRAFRMV